MINNNHKEDYVRYIFYVVFLLSMGLALISNDSKASSNEYKRKTTNVAQKSTTYSELSRFGGALPQNKLVTSSSKLLSFE